MTTSKSYDYLNRLTQISSAPSAAYTLPFAYNYNYNWANQRTKDTLADGSYWNYGYDSLGQVTNGVKYFADGTPLAGQQFYYAFDTIGNRTQTQSGGDAAGANLRVANYSANNLNQITSRDVPGYVDVMGASILTNAVTVNGQTAYRKQEYFRQQLAVNNGSSALWTNITVSGGLNVTGGVYVAQQPEAFLYDADGNLTNDGRWSYTWDGENRLVQMTVNTNVGPQYQLSFAYDAKGRRIQKLVSLWNSSTLNYQPSTTNSFVYDGWNLIADLCSPTSVLRTYTWGSDLSGSLQGAGGIGGLLAISYHGSVTTNCLPAFDGNGNVAALVNLADGMSVANYEYRPFGEVIRATGPMAKVNPMRLSTKYRDDESDLLDFDYRYYKASTGTWLSRDPSSENGGINLYEFCANSPEYLIDPFGLDVNTVYTATCDFCGKGPKFDGSSTAVSDYFWHIYDKAWVPNTWQPSLPTGPICLPIHIPFSGGHWIYFGGWIHVSAKCPTPVNNWALVGFDVVKWPAHDGAPGQNGVQVKCNYQCTVRTATKASVLASGMADPAGIIQGDPNDPGPKPTEGNE